MTTDLQNGDQYDCPKCGRTGYYKPPYNTPDECMSCRWQREHPKPADREPLGFHIEYRAGVAVLVFDNGSCHPATDQEVALWDRLGHAEAMLNDAT